MGHLFDAVNVGTAVVLTHHSRSAGRLLTIISHSNVWCQSYNLEFIRSRGHVLLTGKIHNT